MQSYAILLKNAWFQAEKRENLELQTLKMKTVEGFENFGAKFNDEELFGSFDALKGTKFWSYFFCPNA